MNYLLELCPNFTKQIDNISDFVQVDGLSKPLITNMKIFIVNQFERFDISFKQCLIERNYGGLCLNMDGIRLTCDYLGPSNYWMSKVFSIEEIKNINIESRIFGGHMIWPSKEKGIGRMDENGREIKKSINTARSYCLKERLDYTLFEIRVWYLDKKNNGTPIFQTVLDANAEWFYKFGRGLEGYETFLDVFAFQDSVDDSLNPYDYESFDGQGYTNVIKRKRKYNEYIPKDIEKYKNYVKGTLFAINKRNERITNMNESFAGF